MLIGIDIGGTSTKIGLVDNGRVSAAIRIPTTGHADASAFADALAAEVQRLGADRIQAIGIGAPNANQLTGIIERAPNLPWKKDVPLARMMQERTGIRSVLGNDANAAALGEWRYGAGQGLQDLLLVTLGTGVGSGFIVNGQLMLGSRGNAGELGHTTLVLDEQPLHLRPQRLPGGLREHPRPAANLCGAGRRPGGTAGGRGAVHRESRGTR